MIPHPHDQFASNHAPSRVPPEDSFSFDRDCLFDQASRVEHRNLGTTPAGKSQYFLIFGRWRHILSPEGYFQDERGMRWGVEIVAYRCDDDGVINDFKRRYESAALDFELAVQKLRFQLANDLASLSHADADEDHGYNLSQIIGA